MVRTACTERIAGTGRIACVDLPALPLQLLLRREPDWQDQPAAVVAEDNPQALLLWINEAARRGGILPGMRYAAALSLERNLRAATVSEVTISEAVARLHKHLLRYSPRVEPATHDPGVFWLDAGGLERLWGSPRDWALRLERSLRRAGFSVGLAVGFSRFGSFCLARSGAPGRVRILTSATAETTACHGVPLTRLELSPRTRDDLLRLGLDSVGDLLALPASGLGARFGPELTELVQLARGLRFDPLQAVTLPEPDRRQQMLDEPETNAWRLLFLIKRLLHPLLDQLANRRQAVTRLHLDLKLADRAGTRTRESLRPAAPTLDAVLLMELVRLRLENVALDAGAEHVALEVEAMAAPHEALELFRCQPRRDRQAALRAVARVRAELGADAVVQAELSAGHLPEAAFRWRQVDDLPPPSPAPASASTRSLIRRLLPRPRPLLSGDASLARDQGSALLQAARGPGAPASGPLKLHPPSLLSGGWWHREIRRHYHFLEENDGTILWIYFDEIRQRWYLQGRVE